MATYTKTATAGTSVGAGQAWTNPNNVGSTSAFARSDLAVDGTSKELFAQTFGFSIPSTETVTDISVTAANNDGTSGGSSASWSNVKLMIAGAASGSNQSDGAFLPNATADKTWDGGAGWGGTTPTYTQCNASNFGVEFQVTGTSSLTGPGIQNVRMTIKTMAASTAKGNFLVFF